jgi:hypothetical protein
MIFGEAYEIEAVALRLFNVFGAGQALSNPYTGVLANFARADAKGERPMVFEDGAQRRDFVHVEDVARAFRLAWEVPGAAGEVFNIGSGAPTDRRGGRLLAREMGRRTCARDPGQGAGRRHPQLLRRHRQGARSAGLRPGTAARDLAGPFVDWVAGRDGRGPQRRDAPAARGAEARVGVTSRTYGFVEWFRPGEHERVEEVAAGSSRRGATRLRTHVSWAEFHTGRPAWYDWLIPTLGRRFELLPCVHYTPPSLSRTGEPRARRAAARPTPTSSTRS